MPQGRSSDLLGRHGYLVEPALSTWVRMAKGFQHDWKIQKKGHENDGLMKLNLISQSPFPHPVTKKNKVHIELAVLTMALMSKSFGQNHCGREFRDWSWPNISKHGSSYVLPVGL